jgi:hypothetical protein
MFCFLIAGCTEEYSAVYQSVDAESKWDEGPRIIINNSMHELDPYIVKENKLYLMIQMTHVDRLFRTVVSYPSWDRTEMNRFVEEHADIKPLVPVDWNNWLPKGFGEECLPK